MVNRLLLIALFLFSPFLGASEVKFFGENLVIPDSGQSELIAMSIQTLISNDCSVAVMTSEEDIILKNKGLEVNYSNSIEFDHPPVGKVEGIKKVVITLDENVEKNYRMYIYAYTETKIYSLSKYFSLGYPIINMIMRPMPPNKPSKKDAQKTRTSS